MNCIFYDIIIRLYFIFRFEDKEVRGIVIFISILNVWICERKY